MSNSPLWSSQGAEHSSAEHSSVVDEVRRIQRGVSERDGAARAETLSRATSLVDIRPQLRVCCTDNLRNGKFSVGRATFRQVPRSHLFSRTGSALDCTYRRSPAFDFEESECPRFSRFQRGGLVRHPAQRMETSLSMSVLQNVTPPPTGTSRSERSQERRQETPSLRSGRRKLTAKNTAFE